MLRILVAVAVFGLLTQPVFAAGGDLPLAELKAKLHYMPGSTPGAASADPNLGGEASDKTFLQLHPLKDIAEIDLYVDEITMPAPLLTRLLMLAQCGPYSSAGGKLLGAVKLISGASLLLSYSSNEQHTLISGGRFFTRPSAFSKLPALPDDVKPGITRAELEKHFKPDKKGGMPFWFEKYTMRDVSASEEEVVKLNVGFRPANMSEDAYKSSVLNFIAAPGPDDIVMRLSPLYPETADGN